MINMEASRLPTWNEHVKRAKAQGLNPETAGEISKLLDFPPKPLGHKDIHNSRGLAISLFLHGPEGLRSAANHMLDDLFSEETKRQLKKALKHNRI